MQKKNKCILLLSDKSSGSSALQYLLQKFPSVKLISKTRHSEKETLYWTKAASILNLPQDNMLDSEVPLTRENALKDLENLFKENQLRWDLDSDNLHEQLFEGWERLCNRFGPVFFEKSPHHLHQWSALELIHECSKKRTIDFLFVGLIRNPMDTLYSQWCRWRAIPEKTQYQWKRGYENLLKFRELVGDKIVMITYEDMVERPLSLKKIFQFIGYNNNVIDNHFHNRSLSKWKADRFYGFQLDPKVIEFAEKFGYRKEELENSNKLLWPIYRDLYRFWFRISNKWTSMALRWIRKILQVKSSLI